MTVRFVGSSSPSVYCCFYDSLVFKPIEFLNLEKIFHATYYNNQFFKTHWLIVIEECFVFELLGNNIVLDFYLDFSEFYFKCAYVGCEGINIFVYFPGLM